MVPMEWGRGVGHRGTGFPTCRATGFSSKDQRLPRNSKIIRPIKPLCENTIPIVWRERATAWGVATAQSVCNRLSRLTCPRRQPVTGPGGSVPGFDWAPVRVGDWGGVSPEACGLTSGTLRHTLPRVVEQFRPVMGRERDPQPGKEQPGGSSVAARGVSVPKSQATSASS